jgi:hypothetical protein
MAVDVEDAGLARFFVDQVGVPDLVVEGGAHEFYIARGGSR